MQKAEEEEGEWLIVGWDRHLSLALVASGNIIFEPKIKTRHEQKNSKNSFLSAILTRFILPPLPRPTYLLRCFPVSIP